MIKQEIQEDADNDTQFSSNLRSDLEPEVLIKEESPDQTVDTANHNLEPDILIKEEYEEFIHEILDRDPLQEDSDQNLNLVNTKVQSIIPTPRRRGRPRKRPGPYTTHVTKLPQPPPPPGRSQPCKCKICLDKIKAKTVAKVQKGHLILPKPEKTKITPLERQRKYVLNLRCDPVAKNEFDIKNRERVAKYRSNLNPSKRIEIKIKNREAKWEKRQTLEVTSIGSEELSNLQVNSNEDIDLHIAFLKSKIMKSPLEKTALRKLQLRRKQQIYRSKETTEQRELRQKKQREHKQRIRRPEMLGHRVDEDSL